MPRFDVRIVMMYSIAQDFTLVLASHTGRAISANWGLRRNNRSCYFPIEYLGCSAKESGSGRARMYLSLHIALTSKKNRH